MIDKKQSLTFRVCTLLSWVLAGTLTMSAATIGESGDTVEQTGAVATSGIEAALEAVAEIDEIEIDLSPIRRVDCTI